MSGLTDLDIANLALMELGQPALASLETDTGKIARTMRLAYEPTVKEILRGHPWRCARKKQILAADPDNAPPFGFDYACTLPTDFVRVYKVNTNIDAWEVVGNFLHIDDDAPELTFIARVTTDRFDPLLVSTIVSRLAWRTCLSITDNASAVQNYKAIFEQISGEAKLADALDGTPEEPPIGTWGEARLSEA